MGTRLAVLCTGAFVLASCSGEPATSCEADRCDEPLTVGPFAACALHGGGRVACWGDNSWPLFLGAVPELVTSSPVPVDVPGLTGLSQMTLGDTHACALRADGDVWCWGIAVDAAGGVRTSPEAVLASGDVVAITGQVHTCALHADGTVSCWGGVNSEGELGDGTTVPRRTPAPVVGVSNAVAVAAGIFRTCAVLADGGVACWGYGGLGPDPSSLPVAVAGVSDAARVTMSQSATWIVRSGGGVTGWGSLSTYELGELDWRAPTEVDGLGDVAELAAGDDHVCARTTSGEVWCFGSNAVGQLGDGTRRDRAVPTRVVGLPVVTRLAAGSRVTCAREWDGTLWCWGDADLGGLGAGYDRAALAQLRARSGAVCSPIPVRVAPLPP